MSDDATKTELKQMLLNEAKRYLTERKIEQAREAIATYNMLDCGAFGGGGLMSSAAIEQEMTPNE